MYPRLIKSAAVLAAVSLCAAAASLYWVYRSGHAHLIGSLVFAETVRPESKIKEIVIRSPGYTATLENDNDFWHIREADNYYANFDLVRSLFKNFRETRFIRKQTATPQLLSELDLGNPYRSDALAGTSISILDEQGRELNHLILGKAGAENQTRFARIPSLPDIFTVSGQYTLPIELSSWIQQPLMSLELKDLQAALAFLKETRPFACASIGLYGLSVGGVAAICEAAQNPEIKCVVSEGAYYSFRRVVSRWVWVHYKVPNFPLVPLILHYIRRSLPVNPEQYSPKYNISKIAPRPVFIIHGRYDSAVPAAQAKMLFKRAGEAKEVWLVPGAKQNKCAEVGGFEYKQRLMDFYKQYL